MINQKLFGSVKFLAITATLLTFLFYSPSINNEFLNFDDNKLIYENRIVTNGSDTKLHEIIDYQRFNPHYKPVVILSWNLEYEKWGDNPTPYFFNNILLHTLNTLLLFFIVLLISRSMTTNVSHQKILAFFSAFLFGLHPMSIESVVWATERKDVLFAFFMFSSYLLYILSKKQEKNSFAWLIPSCIFFFLSVFSKSQGIVLFPILFLTDWLINGKLFYKKQIVNKIPYLLILIFALYNYGLFTNFIRQAEGLTAGLIGAEVGENASNIKDLPGLLKRILLINYKFWFWLVHLVIPVKLSISYPRKEFIEMLKSFIYLLPFLSLFLVGLLIRLKNYKWTWFGILFFAISIAPAIAIADIGTGIFVSDRYTYVPSVGIFLVLLMLVLSLKIKEKLKLFIISLACVLYLVGFLQYRPVWKNSHTLFSDVIKKYPDKIPVAYNNLGLYYRNEKNMLSEAAQMFRKSINIDPSYHNAYTNLGNTYFQQQEYKKAIPIYNTLLGMRPGTAEAYSNRGASYSQLGEMEKALADLDTAIMLNPNYIDAYSNRALIRLNTQMPDEAIEDFNKLIKWLPRNPTYFNARGVAYQKKGLHEKAIKDFNKAIELNPNDTRFYLNRTLSYYHLERYKEALEDVEKAEASGAKNINQRYIELLKQQTNI